MDPIISLQSGASPPLPNVVVPAQPLPFAQPPLNVNPVVAPPSQHQGGLTIGKILFDSKDKPKDDGNPRRRGFSDWPGYHERRSPERRPKKRVRERDQELESSDSEEEERKRTSEHERKLEEEHRREKEQEREKEEEERRLQREKLEKEAQEKVAPTQTIVVKGISIRATEEDVARCLAEWGPLPLSAVRIIKDRITRISRGFAFVDFPSVKAAKKLMEDTKTQKLLLDGRKLHFEYTRPNERHEEEVQDWICSSCAAVNFARRASCFKCNLLRTLGAKIAEPGAAQEAFTKHLDEEKTDNLIVRGLEPDVDEAALHYTFAKFGPIKELKVIRDRYTLVSRGFAFVHYNTAEEAKAALIATNMTPLDRTSSTILKVAFARPQPQRQPIASLVPNAAQGATWQPKEFGARRPEVTSSWEPKEFGMSEEEQKAKEAQANSFVQDAAVVTKPAEIVRHPESKGAESSKEQVQSPSKPMERKPMESMAEQVQNAPSKKTDAQAGAGAGPSAGFVWDEASGYYYDAATGYYYDGHRGLYYNGHTKVWYTFDDATQSYKEVQAEATTGATLTSATNGWPQQQQAQTQQSAASTRQPAPSNATQAPLQQAQVPSAYAQVQPAYAPTPASSASLQPNQTPAPAEYGQPSPSYKPALASQGRPQQVSGGPSLPQHLTPLAYNGQRPAYDGQPPAYSGQPIGYGRPSWQPRNNQAPQDFRVPQNQQNLPPQQQFMSPEPSERGVFALGGLGGVGTDIASGFGGRNVDSVNAGGYRDRAAERRGLYGAAPPVRQNDDFGGEPVRQGRPMDEPPLQYERIDQNRALGNQNVGNRMLRNMGWQEGQGLGRGGVGMVDPIKAERITERAGLGVEVPKVDPRFEILPGDSYKVRIQKKTQQRFEQERQRGLF